MRVELEAPREVFHAAVLAIDRQVSEWLRLSMHKNKSHDLRRMYVVSAAELGALCAQLRRALDEPRS